MDLNIDTLANLQEMTCETGTNEELYEKMLHFLHYQINQKDIHFSSELRNRFDVDEDENLKFDEGYFETENYNPLFVLMAALANDEVYRWLEFAYNKTHEEKFSIDILEKEIKYWEDSGLTVILITYHTLYKNQDDLGTLYQENTFDSQTGYLYSITYAEAEDIGDNKFKITVHVDYRDNHSKFSAVVDKSEKLNEILNYVMIRKYDSLYLYIRDKIDEEINEWTKNIEAKKRH